MQLSNALLVAVATLASADITTTVISNSMTVTMTMSLRNVTIPPGRGGLSVTHVPFTRTPKPKPSSTTTTTIIKTPMPIITRTRFPKGSKTTIYNAEACPSTPECEKWVSSPCYKREKACANNGCSARRLATGWVTVFQSRTGRVRKYRPSIPGVTKANVEQGLHLLALIPTTTCSCGSISYSLVQST